MSSLNAVRFVNQKQVQAVCRAFLRAHPGQEWDAIEARIALEQEWGIIVDHHEFSGAMDVLCRAGELVLTRPGGYTKYQVKETVSFYKTKPLFTILEGGNFYSMSDNPVVTLLLYLYVAGHEDDRFWRVLEEIQDSTQFEIHIGETVYSYQNDETREAFKQAREEYDKEGEE